MTILTPETITKVIMGDASLINSLPVNDQELLQQCYNAAGNPQVTKDSLILVLNNLKSRLISKVNAQKWASFIRRGYLPGTTFPVAPIYIVIDLKSEDDLMDIIGRLDELGDIIDGDMTENEIEMHLAKLKQL